VTKSSQDKQPANLWQKQLNISTTVFSRPYLSNGRAIGTVVVRPSVCLSVVVCRGRIVAKRGR